MSVTRVQSIAQQALARHSSNQFTPTTAQRQAKGAYWSHFFSTGDSAPEVIDPAVAARYSGYNEILEWWSLPGFTEWFSNGEEFRQRVEYTANLALDVLQAVLSDIQARPGERLQAAKMALEVASKFPRASASTERYTDQRIAEMGRKELEEFINSKLRILPTVDTPPAT